RKSARGLPVAQRESLRFGDRGDGWRPLWRAMSARSRRLVEGVGGRIVDAQRGSLADGGVPGVGAVAGSCGFEEGCIESGIDEVPELVVAVSGGSAGEPRRAIARSTSARASRSRPCCSASYAAQ